MMDLLRLIFGIKCREAKPTMTENTVTKDRSSRWAVALHLATPSGAGSRTARAEGLTVGGIDASKAIASRDWPKAVPIIPTIEKAAAEAGIPSAILMAIASRESHFGAMLDSNGYGDHRHAYGVCQVDQRYHDPTDFDGPAGLAHFRQAAEIFKSMLDGVIKKHPTWPDDKLLEGALVAYNSGIKNVVTIDGMNRGTTGNDYGSDTLGRAQYYQNALAYD